MTSRPDASDRTRWESCRLGDRALAAALASGDLGTGPLSRIPSFARREDVDRSVDALNGALCAAGSLPSAAPRIVWVGKTMAGKSTIFEALTDGRRERVGRGAQRTTLVPEARVRDGLVMVDTPGVGARDGTADLRLAIEEALKADALVWVVAESIQLTVTEAIAIMAGLGKPVVVLVNAKLGLADNRLRDHFLSRPERVLLREFDDQARRVRHVLAQAGAAPTAIVPVHCEAALVAREMESDDAELATRLWSASNVDQAWQAIQDLISGRSVVLRLCAEAAQVEDLVRARARQLEEVGEDLVGWLEAREAVTQGAARVLPGSIAEARAAAVASVLAVADKVDVSAWVEANLKRKDISQLWADTVAGLKPEEALTEAVQAMAGQLGDAIAQVVADWAEDIEHDTRSDSHWAWTGTSGLEYLKPGRVPWADLGKSLLGAVSAGRAGFQVHPVAGVALGVTSLLASLGRLWSRQRLHETQKRQALGTRTREALNGDLEELRRTLRSEVESAAAQASADCDARLVDSLEQLARAHLLPTELGAEAELLRSGLKGLPRALFTDAARSQGVLVHSDEVVAVERAPGYATKVLVTGRIAQPFAMSVRMPERTDVAALGWHSTPAHRVRQALGVGENDWPVTWTQRACTIVVPSGAIPSVQGGRGCNREAAERLLGHRIIVAVENGSSG